MRKVLLVLFSMAMLVAFAACGDSGSGGGGGGGGGGTVGEMDPSITNAQLGVYCTTSNVNVNLDQYLYFYANNGEIYKVTHEFVYPSTTLAQFAYNSLVSDAEDNDYYDVRISGKSVFYSEDSDLGSISDMRTSVNAGNMSQSSQTCVIAYPQS